MPARGSTEEAARAQVVERNLVRTAFGHLTNDAFLTLPFEALGPTKALLKRFFSVALWSDADDDALADAVGPGAGSWRRQLDPDLLLEYGWVDGRFGVRVTSSAEDAPALPDPLIATFDGPVVPEATPNPRAIRFRAGPIHEGPSRWYESAAAAADDRAAARLFAEFDEVANVLVGNDFVAVSLRRPGDWERLLAPILTVVTEEFAGPADTPPVPEAPTQEATTGEGTATARRSGRLDEAWRELGALRPAHPDDLARILEAAASEDQFRRQVAANLLREADPGVAAREWARLVLDPARSVRRAAVDAMVDAGRQELRPLLEASLADTDAWVRWKALRGLVELGPDPSRAAIAAHADDPDFRVRLEVAAALRPAG